MSDKDIVEEARDLAIRLGHDRKSAFCKAVTHKVIEAEAQNLISRLADEVERLRKQAVEDKAAFDELYGFWKKEVGAR